MKLFFGGTFDPIHNGHLRLAIYISSHFKQVVNLLPLGGTPDYKPQPQASLKQRLAMLTLLVKKYPQQLAIDLSEAKRSEYSPTFYTLQRLRAEYGQREPLFFILGGDSLVSLDSWHHWQELFELSNFVVALRPDYPLNKMSPKLCAATYPRLVQQADTSQAAGQIILTHFNPMDISSTQIRQNCAAGISITELVAAEIDDYIKLHNLYKRKNQC